MKQKLRLFSTLLLLAVVSAAWGAEQTWSHEFASPEKVQDNAITVDGVTWNITTSESVGTPTISTGNYSSTYGLKFGSSKSNYFSSVTFSTDYFNGYNVKSVTVNILNNGSKQGTFTAQQGSTTIGSTSQTFGQTWTDLTVNTTPGTGGELSFTYSVEQAFYIHSITVVYEENTSGKETPTLEVTGYTGPDFRMGTSMNLTITTNSNSNIERSFTGNAINPANFTQSDGTATITVYPNAPGESTLKFYVVETDVYAYKEVVLSFKVRKTLTQTEIDATGITNTDIANGTAAGSLLGKMLCEQADGTYNFYLSSTHSDNLFTWSSSDENVATIEADGTVTLVGAGTTTITANFIGTGIFEPSSATYELTVTNSDGPVISTATFNFPEMGYANQAEVTTATKDGVTVTFDKGTNSYAPKYYTTGTAVRAYGGNTFTISSDNIIKKIVITFGESDGSNSITTDVNTYENGTWTGSANSVTFTIGGTSGNRRIQAITVTYEEADQTISVAPQISGEESFLNETTVTITAAEGAAIYYTTDGTDPTTSSTQYSAPFTLGATTTVKAIAVESGKTPSKVAEKTFTKHDVMTVAEALTLIDGLEEDETSDFVYVKGVVTQVESYSDKYHSITYSIADVGTTTPELKVYGGKNLDNTDFSSMDDLGVNDVVTIYGKLKEYNSTPEFDSNNYIVAIERSKQPAGLSYATTTITKQVGDEPFTNELTNPHSLAVTYSSDNEAVATVDATGKVTIVAAGPATITASFEGNDTYNEGSASYSLTVSNGEKAVFKKVTSTDDITDGEYLIVYEDGSLAFDGSLTTLDAVGNTVTVEIENSLIEASTANAFTVSAMTGGYSIKSASGQYIGQESNANGMKTSATDAIANTITFDTDGNANIVSGGAYLRYNDASNQLRFRYYKSSTYEAQKAIQLYKKVETVTASITAAGYATFANAKAVDFSAADGLTVMTAKYDDNTGKINYTIVESKKVPEATAVVLKGEAKDYTGVVIEEAPDLTNNDLQVKLTESFASNGTQYCLAKKNDVVGFYKVKEGVNVKAGKAYLVITGQNAKDFYAIDDETTGISQMENGQLAIDNAEIYNLSGQRVNKAQKGIYIVNGKKVVVK